MMTPSPLTPLDGTEHTRFAAFQLNNLRRNTEYATNSMHVPRSSVLRTQSDSKTVFSSRHKSIYKLNKEDYGTHYRWASFLRTNENFR